MINNLLGLIILSTIFITSFHSAAAQDLKPKSLKQQAKKYQYEDEFASYEAEFSKSSQKTIYDPLEKMNRKIFAFNEAVDIYFIEPVTKGYRYITPKPVRKCIHNFVTNLTLPISTFNSFAQGKLDNGLATFSNFLINSTLGIGGLFDVAGNKNIRYEDEDFGQTLGHYGMDTGPFLMIPLLGPSSGRDFGGYAFDRTIDPVGFNQLRFGGEVDSINAYYRFTDGVVYNLDLRESLLDPIDDARKDSFDLYATLRSVYVQQRDAKILK